MMTSDQQQERGGASRKEDAIIWLPQTPVSTEHSTVPCTVPTLPYLPSGKAEQSPKVVPRLSDLVPEDGSVEGRTPAHAPEDLRRTASTFFDSVSAGLLRTP